MHPKALHRRTRVLLPTHTREFGCGPEAYLPSPRPWVVERTCEHTRVMQRYRPCAVQECTRLCGGDYQVRYHSNRQRARSYITRHSPFHSRKRVQRCVRADTSRCSRETSSHTHAHRHMHTRTHAHTHARTHARRYLSLLSSDEHTHRFRFNAVDLGLHMKIDTAAVPAFRLPPPGAFGLAACQAASSAHIAVPPSFACYVGVRLAP